MYAVKHTLLAVYKILLLFQTKCEIIKLKFVMPHASKTYDVASTLCAVDGFQACAKFALRTICRLKRKKKSIKERTNTVYVYEKRTQSHVKTGKLPNIYHKL